ncbi:hypothetical protein KY285_006843 [Solanum tuberosum]|nr:hypothetical protein KY285_006843 [Solanum tuberosum]
MASSSSASNSQYYPRWKYDIFLSFRGEDPEKFYESLVPRLKEGDSISEELVKAIEESQVAIVVFSKNYATSRWCLNELVKIMECKEEKGQIVIPIFYDVDPSHVRYQSESFAEAFAKHELRSKDDVEGMQKVQGWRNALTAASNLKEYDIRYGELIELNLYNCGRLKRFPCVNVESLIYMDLEFCSSLEKFPKIFGTMKPELKIKTGLSGIRELPSSFGFRLYKDEPELESLLQTEHCIGTKRSRYDNSEHRDEASCSSSKEQRSHSDIRRGVISSSETLQHIPRQWRKPEYEMKLSCSADHVILRMYTAPHIYKYFTELSFVDEESFEVLLIKCRLTIYMGLNLGFNF